LAVDFSFFSGELADELLLASFLVFSVVLSVSDNV
jgi:hypothetical protein